MNLTIFGATGRTGQYLIEQALAAGHEVTVYVRNPARLAQKHANLRIVQGEISDSAKVAEVIAGADAVISALGAVRGRAKDLMAIAAKNIIAGMKEKSVNRLIFASGAGVRAPEDIPTGIHKWIGGLMRIVARDVLEDSQRGIEMVKTSDLDWTIARAPMLQDAPYNGKYWVGYVGKEMGRTLARGNFAHFLLAQVADKKWLGKMPALSDER